MVQHELVHVQVAGVHRPPGGDVSGLGAPSAPLHPLQLLQRREGPRAQPPMCRAETTPTPAPSPAGSLHHQLSLDISLEDILIRT